MGCWTNVASSALARKFMKKNWIRNEIILNCMKHTVSVTQKLCSIQWKSMVPWQLFMALWIWPSSLQDTSLIYGISAYTGHVLEPNLLCWPNGELLINTPIRNIVRITILSEKPSNTAISMSKWHSKKITIALRTRFKMRLILYFLGPNESYLTCLPANLGFR